MYSYGSPHMAAQKQDDQHERTFSSYVRIQVVVLKTYLGRWTIGRSGERGSGISVLPARYDDDDDDDDDDITFLLCYSCLFCLFHPFLFSLSPPPLFFSPLIAYFFRFLLSSFFLSLFLFSFSSSLCFEIFLDEQMEHINSIKYSYTITWRNFKKQTLIYWLNSQLFLDM